MTDSTTAVRYTPPAWATGRVSHHDAAFLTGLVQEVAPDAAVEIGVASGCSSAVLLHALAGVHGTPDPSNRWLYSFDAIDYCYFDPARRVGEAVDEMAPRLKSAWSLTIGRALAARRVLRERELSFAFIDADHSHPWPTFDLLALLPVLRRGAWVALHDIRLSQMSGEWQVHGAEYLFDDWPWTKRTEPIDRNIGAIRLDAPHDAIVEYCLNLLTKTWQVCPPREVRAALELPGLFLREDATSQKAAIDLHRALRAADGGSKRPLILWGAGQAGRESLTLFRGIGFEVDGFVDRDVRKHGTTIDGIDVGDAGRLRASDNPRPFVIACGLHAEAISRELEEQGFVEGDDFVSSLKWR